MGLEIRSGGGSLEEGLDIARVVRDKGLVVYASKKCNSACAFIFFAAKERYIGRRCKIGVHSVSNDRGKEDGDSVRVTVRMSRLLVGLGVPHSVIGKIVATPPAKITFLDNRDLAGLNVHRTNPFRNNHDAANVARTRRPARFATPALTWRPRRRPTPDTGPARQRRRVPPERGNKGEPPNSQWQAGFTRSQPEHSANPNGMF